LKFPQVRSKCVLPKQHLGLNLYFLFFFYYETSSNRSFIWLTLPVNEWKHKVNWYKIIILCNEFKMKPFNSADVWNHDSFLSSKICNWNFCTILFVCKVKLDFFIRKDATPCWRDHSRPRRRRRRRRVTLVFLILVDSEKLFA